MNVRELIVAAALACTAAGCATTKGPTAPGATAQAATAQGAGDREEEYRFEGHRLKVRVDAAGVPTSARALDKNDVVIPAFVVPAREVTVCVPKAVGAAQGAGQQCEPFLYMPEKTFFKIGTGTICQMWYMGKLIYYQC